MVRNASQSEYEAVEEMMARAARTQPSATAAPASDQRIAGTLSPSTLGTVKATLEGVEPVAKRSAKSAQAAKQATRARTIVALIERIGNAGLILAKATPRGLSLTGDDLRTLRRLLSDIDAHLAHEIASTKPMTNHLRHLEELRSVNSAAWRLLHG